MINAKKIIHVCLRSIRFFFCFFFGVQCGCVLLGVQCNSHTVRFIGCAVWFTHRAVYWVCSVNYRPCTILGGQCNLQTIRYIGFAVEFTDHALYCVDSVIYRQCAIFGCAVEFTHHALYWVCSVVHRPCAILRGQRRSQTMRHIGWAV